MAAAHWARCRRRQNSKHAKAFEPCATASVVHTCDLVVPSRHLDGATDVRMYCNGLALLDDAPVKVPLVTVKAAGVKAAQEQHLQMKRLEQIFCLLGDGIADGRARNKVSFCMGERAEDDVFDFGHSLDGCESDVAAKAMTFVKTFLRSHCFDVLHALGSGKLSRLQGRFYIFDPFRKTRQNDSVNTQWHQDGDSLVTEDDFFGHYYLPEPDEEAVTGCAAADWAEVALPNRHDESISDRAAATEAEEDDGEFVWDWSGEGTTADTRWERIAPENLVTLPAREHRFIILHDAECYHRVPLAALVRRPHRTIARVEFHGLDPQGGKIHFVPRQRDSWKPLGCVLVPSDLARLCDEYARSRDEGTREEGLRAYVGADHETGLRNWLKGRLQRDVGSL